MCAQARADFEECIRLRDAIEEGIAALEARNASRPPPAPSLSITSISAGGNARGVRRGLLREVHCPAEPARRPESPEPRVTAALVCCGGGGRAPLINHPGARTGVDVRHRQVLHHAPGQVARRLDGAPTPMQPTAERSHADPWPRASLGCAPRQSQPQAPRQGAVTVQPHVHEYRHRYN